MTDGEPPRSDERVQTACQMILAIVSVGGALYFLRPVLVPFVLAVLFTYSLSPLYALLRTRLNLSPRLAVVSTGLVGLLVLSAIGVLFAMAVVTLAEDLPALRGQVEQFTDSVVERVPWESLGVERPADPAEITAIPEQGLTLFLSAILEEVTFLVSNGALVVVFMIFILMGKDGSRHAVQHQEGGLLADIRNRVTRYLVLLVLISAVTGLSVGVVLTLLGVRFAWVFGFLAFLLNFIPNVGSIIATLLPVPVILLDPSLTPAAKTLAVLLPGVFQFAIGNLATPKLQGDALQLHPVAILMALVFFGMIWGVIGAFLATPLLGVTKIIFDRVPATAPLGRILAGDLDALGGGEP